MTIKFHRLTDPIYNEETIGVTHDYINNLMVGTPSLADTAKVGGPNEGTYFVAFGEDATSENVNRPVRALAQNCDFLDDIVHRDLAEPVLVPITDPGSSFVILDDVFVGPPGTPNDGNARNGLVRLFIKDGAMSGTALVWETSPGSWNWQTAWVASIHNGSSVSVIGDPTAAGGNEDSFFTNPTVDLGFTPPSTVVPPGTYYLQYWRRSNVKNQPIGMLSGLGATAGSLAFATAQALIALSFHTDGPSWKDGHPNPATSMYGRVAGIITDLGVNTEGSDRINSQARAGTNISLSGNTSIFSQLSVLTDFINLMLDGRSNVWGTNLRGSAADAVTARHVLQGAPYATSMLTLLEEYQQDPGDSLCKTRKYYMVSDTGSDGSIVYTSNLRWSQGDLGWYYDNSAKSGTMRFPFEEYQVPSGLSEPIGLFDSLGYQNVGLVLSSSWYEPPTTQWITGYSLRFTNGFIQFGSLSGDERILNPHHTQPNVDNKLYAKNVCKAWAKIGVQYDTVYSPYIADGFNVDSVEYDGGDSRILKITWAEPFADDNYIVDTSFFYTPSLVGILNYAYTATTVETDPSYCVIIGSIISAAEGLPTLIGQYAIDFDDFCDPTPPPDWEAFIYIVAYGAQP